MNTSKAYFLIADITGFTSFVAGTELEHSQKILSEVLTLIIGKLTPAFNLVEVEGDAVFVFAPIEKYPRGELILEIVESTYYSFRDTMTTFQRITTCSCMACQMISTLDLKFVIHCGDFVMNNIAGKKKPLGNAVIVLHRLLKNSVSKDTGWKAYYLITKDCLESLNVPINKSYSVTEQYEHLGVIRTEVINLDEKYEEYQKQKSITIDEKDAHYIFRKEFPVPASILWDWFNNPKRKSLYIKGSDWNVSERPSGRTTKDATNHCSSSKFIEMVLDYKPFDYFTTKLYRGFLNFTICGVFKPLNDTTELTYMVKMNGKLPEWILKILCRVLFASAVKDFAKLEKLIKDEQSSSV